MLPARLLKDRFWLLLALAILVIAGSLPVISLGLYAESRPIFSVFFSAIWTLLMFAAGFALWLKARNSPQFASVIIVVALAVLSLLYRAPSMFTQPQFIAEDACIFFVQQRDMGWTSFITPYNGYYHTVVRIIAEVAAHFPTLFGPALYSLAWLGLYVAVIAYILLQYPNRKLAPLIALVPAFISHTCEIFLVATDAIWVGGLALTAFLLLPVPEIKNWLRYLLSAALLLFSLSGPFSVILSPFYILRWIFNRKTFPLAYLLPVIIGAAIQLTGLHSYYTARHDGTVFNAATYLLCFKIAVLRIPWSLAIGYQPFDPYWMFIVPPFLVLLGFMASEICGDLRKQIFTVGCLVLCALYVAMDCLRITPLDVLQPLVNGDRYFYIPKILFVWALFQLAATAHYRKPFYLALVLCALGSMAEFTTTQPAVDYDWPKYAALIDSGQPMTLPVNPGWTTSVNSHSAAK